MLTAWSHAQRVRLKVRQATRIVSSLERTCAWQSAPIRQSVAIPSLEWTFERQLRVCNGWMRTLRMVRTSCKVWVRT